MTRIILLISKFNLVHLFFAIIIIKIKSSDDILNGISKLDDIIKISIFSRKKSKFAILFTGPWIGVSMSEMEATGISSFTSSI